MRYFLAVLEHESLRRAAAELNTSPSVISRQIRLLEDDLGAVLFERTSRGIAPTEAARHLFEYAKACELQQEHLRDRLHGVIQGSVRIAATEGFIETLMDEALIDFLARFPKVDVSLHVCPANEVVAQVLEELAHIGLTYNPPVTPEIRFCASTRQPVMLAVHPNHPLASARRPVAMREAVLYPFSLMPDAFGLGQLVRMAAYAEKIRLEPTFVANSLFALTRFARTGSGVAFLTEFAMTRELRVGELVAVPISQPLLQNAHARALVKTDRPMTRATSECLKHIASRMSVFNTTPDEKTRPIDNGLRPARLISNR
ncbi:LysR family transcriptional regulator [Trinickia symbiotica]|uniref:LysR family transcriptional regulator n=1 Tax=Trinickia symbiotica TaxID=863227 RepID=UPI0003620DE1|nr:LysR family transcriptional regulator [Trinickia symbiotica]